jgi:hypothetical protein
MIEINYHSKSIKEIQEFIDSGLRMTFENGNTISIQFGFGNYCDNKFESKPSCKNAEIAIWDKDDNWHNFGGDTVKGYCSTDEIAKWIFFAANFEVNSKEI